MSECVCDEICTLKMKLFVGVKACLFCQLSHFKTSQHTHTHTLARRSLFMSYLTSSANLKSVQ